MKGPIVFERDQYVYVVGPVAPARPSEQDLTELAFAAELRKMAPNEHLAWYQGRYVEADRPNSNGAEWSADTLSIASLTPMLMPVTVMHDPRTAVGMIADARMVTRDAGADRNRIDTTLGLWRHRFPDVVAEAEHNYEQATLMQSMECLPAFYDCGACEQRFPNLGGAEQKNWCEHLAASAAEGRPLHRRLGNVTFTGTGLIFGTRGAQGAYTEAHLDVLQDEVAAFHLEAKRPTTTVKRPRSKRNMEIEDREYAELIAARTERDTLKPRVETLETEAAKVKPLEAKVETAELAQKAAEDAAAAEKKKREQLEEDARTETLAADRTGKLGKAFLAKLTDGIKAKLTEQAKTLSDEDWTARLDELAELTGTKADEQGSAEGDDDVLTGEETARSGGGGLGGGTSPTDGQAPSQVARTAVLGKLVDILP